MKILLTFMLAIGLAPTAAGTGDVARLARAHRAFACDIYQSLRGKAGNLFYSPYSLSLSFGMVAVGAHGDTAREISETFHFRLPPSELHPAMNALDRALISSADRGYRLAIANALWVQQGYSVLPAYREAVGRHYRSEPRDIDFRGDPKKARLVINDWIRERTDGRIQDLLAGGSINKKVRILVTNAVTFEAVWRDRFDWWKTKSRWFHLRDGTRVATPTMRGSIWIGYAAMDGYQVIDMPYKGDSAAMTVLLPDEGRFERFERRLDAGVVAEALESLDDRTVDLFMPRFDFNWSFDGKGQLSAMGMPATFDPERADFSGINGIACPSEACLFVSGAAHEALIEVNEQGTKAAAATAGMITIRVSDSRLPRVSIDRPFVFLIRDIPTGTILFMGRVLDPRP